MKILCSMTLVASYRWYQYGIKLLLLVAISIYLNGCKQQNEVAVLNGKTMGTYWRVQIAQPIDKKNIQEIQDNIEKELVLVNQIMSTYIKDSELMQFNQLPSTETVSISPALRKVISKALEVSRETEGYYDITVAPLVDLWGFGPKKITRAPTHDEIQLALSRVGYQFLVLNDRGLRKEIKDVAIDLSSIAKGYGVDTVAESLQKQGYVNYLVDIGGEVRANGNKFGQEWTIGIESPTQTKEDITSLIRVKDRTLSMATSGNYRNYVDYSGVRAVHIINPKTGMPEQSTLLSATVIADDCMTADAYATALMVLGDKNASVFAQKNNLAALLIYPGDKDGDFRVKTTQAYDRLIGEK